MMTTQQTYTVVESMWSGEIFVKTNGGFMEMCDWLGDGGRVEQWDMEIHGTPHVMGRYTNQKMMDLWG